MDADLPLIAAAFLAAAAIVVSSPRARAYLLVGALVLTPVILVWHVQDNTAFDTLRDRPAVLAILVAAGLAVVAGLAVLFARRAAAFPIAVVATLPFRVPIESGGTSANLLVPLYAVIGAGVLAYAVPRLRMSEDREDAERPGLVEVLLAGALALYAVQATYSSDSDHALENTVFFYVPFALLFVLLARVAWTPRLIAWCLGVLVAIATVLVGIGFVEYATRHLLLNPKVITSNQFESYFRVNSLFFDPNIYGRFLATVMLGLAGWLLWTTRPRHAWLAIAALAVLWAGLVLSFSQSSFTALLLGLAVLAALRWSPWRTVAVAVAIVAAGAAFVLAAPDAINLELGDSRSADAATSGRYDLITGGIELFTAAPVAGHGAGSFQREYRRQEKASSQRATAASHTIPVTVAAEQGVGGLLVYLALLAAAFRRLLRGARRAPARAVVAAMFAALVAHTFLYAAFLEDPLAWALLGAGTAMAAGLGRSRIAPAPQTDPFATP